MWGNPCAWAQQRLPLLAGDELVGPDRRRVERHLIGCPRCRRRLASLREALEVLHAAAADPLPQPDPPVLWTALARQIRESRRPAAASSWAWSPSWFAERPRWVAAWSAAASLVLGLGLAARLLRPAPRPSAAPQVLIGQHDRPAAPPAVRRSAPAPRPQAKPQAKPEPEPPIRLADRDTGPKEPASPSESASTASSRSGYDERNSGASDTRNANTH